MDANNMKRIFVNLRTGDRVASVAQPIAKAIDKITGSNIQHCKSCKKRREYLNNLTK